MRPQGFKAFVIVWSGQIVSILASGMTGFALSIWTFQKTGSVTAMGAVQVFYLVPFLLVSPLAGALIDRHSRKLMMATSDLVAVVGTAFIMAMNAFGQLELWHLFLAASLNGLGNSFQWPAYSAAVSVMLPKEQYSRANGMLGLMESAPNILAPILAGTILPLIGLGGILAVDLASFFVALLALSTVSIPNPPRTAEGQASKGSLFKEAAYGFKYIFARPGLRNLQLVFLGINLFSSMGITLIAPMVLARTGTDAASLGIVQACMSAGAVAGGIIMSVWKGFDRKVTGLGIGLVGIGLLGTTPFGLGPSMVLWAATAVSGGIFSAMANSSSQVIWQSKVAPDVQGRVFASRRIISWLTTPVAPLLAGLLADTVLEPAAASGNGSIAVAILAVSGSGTGSGMAFALFLCGLATAAVGVFAFVLPSVRNVEADLPDQPESTAAS